MSYSAEQFFAKIKPYVIEDAKKSAILPSLTAAQAFIESGCGNSGLTQKCNNLFGIKGEYNGQYGLFWTTEYYGSKPTRIQAKFRKYPSWAESIADHSRLFTTSKRYKNLVGCRQYTLACKYVKDDGYATSPTYTNTLINTINKYKLYSWDSEVLGIDIEPPKNDPADTKKLPILKKGSKGQQVLAWQNFLFINGYNPGLLDGKFGVLTEEAVKAFQLSHGLKVDGIIGANTWKAAGIEA